MWLLSHSCPAHIEITDWEHQHATATSQTAGWKLLAQSYPTACNCSCCTKCTLKSIRYRSLHTVQLCISAGPRTGGRGESNTERAAWGSLCRAPSHGMLSPPHHFRTSCKQSHSWCLTVWTCAKKEKKKKLARAVYKARHSMRWKNTLKGNSKERPFKHFPILFLQFPVSLSLVKPERELHAQPSSNSPAGVPPVEWPPSDHSRKP